MIPVWLVVLALGFVLLTIEVLSQFESEDLPTPKVVPSGAETLPPGPPVHDKFSDFKDGAGSGG